METKWIAGPWRAFNHSWCETSVLADGFDHAVCMLDINYATEESQEADEAQMAATARLIAAAPDMFEVLDNIGGLSRALRVGGPDEMDLQELSDALQEAVDMANAMVAKATGA